VQDAWLCVYRAKDTGGPGKMPTHELETRGAVRWDDGRAAGIPL
jgi:hypothetical protein